ncbi:hypothetical protein LCGC14_1034240 [marine sediment metagenome]|uniref:D-alanyl-D-alanine dipeptidase n=2 Tax=root TaxID=1 RepID=A0A831VPU3_9FLAO|nr:peptidase M15 [Pricia antarctica]
MIRSIFFLFLTATFLFACKENQNKDKKPKGGSQKMVVTSDSVTQKKTLPLKSLRSFKGLADTTFIRLAEFSDEFAYDLRYATKNNFLKEKVYDCAECYTRVKTAKALLAANTDFRDKGVRIKFFDCYRPNSVQYKMWEIVPNPQYVANPKKGSIHNKGGAVDITLETLDGEALDMGTDFDYFGKRAYHDMTNLPQHILDNRKLLKQTMEKHGFWSIRTEWWHYNLGAASNDEVADFKWPCD